MGDGVVIGMTGGVFSTKTIKFVNFCVCSRRHSARAMVSTSFTSAGGWARAAAATISRTEGRVMPRKGISDFMYACMAGAAAGLAAARSSR